MGNRVIYKGHSVGETIQATIMPTASVDHLGEIVQYVGPDTTTSPIYRKGKFYECKPYGTSGYRWLSVELIRGVNHAMYSEAWGGTDSKSDLIDTLNAFNEDFIEAAQDCDISNNVALYSCYVDTPYEGMPTNTQIKAYYDSDAGWVYRGYSSSTADEFAIIPTGSPITDVTVVKLGSGGSTLYADSPIGSIIPFGGATAPDGFLLCQGQVVSRTTYAELFAVIGTSFGSGDGSTTFNVPDLREATTKGVGLSGKTSDHFDSDGIALGEFVEDRVKKHQHSYSGNTGDMSNNATGYMYPVGFTSDETPGHTGNITKIQNGRGMWRAQGTSKDIVEGYSVYIDVSHTHAFSGTTEETGGATTEVKAVGVNYIIKAKQVGAPADFMDAVDEAVEEAVHNTLVNTTVIQSDVKRSVTQDPTVSTWYAAELQKPTIPTGKRLVRWLAFTDTSMITVNVGNYSGSIDNCIIVNGDGMASTTPITFNLWWGAEIADY